MEHPLPQSYASHTVSGPWSPYQDHIVDYAAGESYLTAHHVQVNEEQGSCGSSYQHQQYEHFHQQTYVTAQNDLSHHPPLPPPDVSTYWTALPMEPTDMYYPTCYDNSQDLSLAHCHTATGDLFQYGQHGACGGVCSGTTSYDTSCSIYSESDTPLVTSPPAPTLPAPAPHPTTTRDQTANEHNIIQWDSLIVTRSALYEGSAAAAAAATTTTTATYQATEPSYNQIRPYGDTYTTATAPQPHYAPEPVKEEPQQQQQQLYVATCASNPDGQNHHVAPVPVTAQVPLRETKPKAESPALPPRGKSPMGHLPYPEDMVGIKAEGQRRDASVLRGWAQSPSPASTRTRTPSPTPLSPFLQTLTFITYPDTEPRGHRDGRDGGGTTGAGGAESDDLGDDDDGSHSPPRRGRRGKKQAKKDPFLACFFCRGRKIACHPKHEDGGDRTCTQCAKRHLLCQYPLTSRRGQRKPREQAGDSDSTLWSDSPTTPPSTTSTSVTAARANSKPRARASSKLPAPSPLVNAA